MKLVYLRAENRQFITEYLHRYQHKVTVEDVEYSSEILLGNVLQPACPPSASVLCFILTFGHFKDSDHFNRAPISHSVSLDKLFIKPCTQTHRTSFGSGLTHFIPFLNGNETAV